LIDASNIEEEQTLKQSANSIYYVRKSSWVIHKRFIRQREKWRFVKSIWQQIKWAD